MNHELRFDILNKKQRSILQSFVFLKSYGFYLAGGTALALAIGHRKSLDFDFYSRKSFDSGRLLRDITRHFKNVLVVNQAPDTLLLFIDGVNVSFFAYPYPLLKPFIKTEKINLAALADIAAMKMVAIVQRRSKRDYVDIFYLLQYFTLEEMITFTMKKYKKVFNPYLVLRALIYFEDIESAGAQRNALLADIDWETIKKKLVQETKSFRGKQLTAKR